MRLPSTSENFTRGAPISARFTWFVCNISYAYGSIYANNWLSVIVRGWQVCGCWILASSKQESHLMRYSWCQLQAGCFCLFFSGFVLIVVVNEWGERKSGGRWGVDELKSGKRKEQWLTNCYRWFGIASRTTCKTNTKCTWYLLTEASCCSLVDWLCRVRLQLKCDPLGRVPIYLSERKIYPNAISNRIRCGSM